MIMLHAYMAICTNAAFWLSQERAIGVIVNIVARCTLHMISLKELEFACHSSKGIKACLCIVNDKPDRMVITKICA